MRTIVWSVVVLLMLAVAPQALAQSTAEAPAGADASTTYGPAVWMRIPRIGVDSHISDVGVVDGYYDVPWFDIGHHVDSANPGDNGNSIFNGHVLTIDAGHVFEQLKDLQPGDAVYVYTDSFRTDWAVGQVYAVSDTDSRFLAQTTQPRLTLYTCTGTFNPIERNYLQRLVVVGELVQAVPRT